MGIVGMNMNFIWNGGYRYINELAANEISLGKNDHNC